MQHILYKFIGNAYMPIVVYVKLANIIILYIFSENRSWALKVLTAQIRVKEKKIATHARWPAIWNVS